MFGGSEMESEMRAATIATALCAAVLFACGTDDPVAPTTRVEPDREEPVEAPPEPSADTFSMILEPVGELPHGRAMSSVPLRVRLRDAETGAVVAGERIDYRLTHAPDEETSLAVEGGTTSDEGTVVVDLRLGATVGSAIVMVSHPEADPLYLDVRIDEPLDGSIRVTVREPSNPPVALAPYRIAIFDASNLVCADYHGRGRQPEAFAELHAMDGAPIVAEGLTGGSTYTVVAEAMGAGARALAAGCTDDVEVRAGLTTPADVRLDLLPIGPSGTYLVDGVWDVSEAVASTNGAAGMFVGVIEFMADPGAAIYDLVITTIEGAVDFPIGMILGFTGVRQAIVDYVNGQIFQFAPLATFSAVASDLDALLNQMEVESVLTISKTDDEYNFFGHEEWTSITVHWTWRCQNSADPNCGVQVLDLVAADAGAASVVYDWIGHVEGYDQLVVDSHQATLDVGRLQLYLLEKVIIPELTGGNADTMGEALAYWVNCDDLAAQVLGGNDICDPTGLFCIGETLINGACVAAMNEIAAQVTGPLQNQPVLDLDLSATARLVDTEAVSMAGEIVEGRTNGVVQGGMEQIDATWTAVRIH